MIWNEIRNLLSSESRNILGVMSGTSADGLELAVVSCFGSGKSMKLRLLEHSSVQFESSFHEEIVKTFDPSLSGVDRVNSMNFLIGKKHAAVIRSFLDRTEVKVDAIAYHGQTVYHDPAVHATLQIGEADIVSSETGLPVVFDFRKKDMVFGGEGAPIIPYFDWIYFESGIYAVNLGGIANVTYVAEKLEDVKAFDTGPANCLIDLVAKRYFNMEFDEGGKIAARGSVDSVILDVLVERDRKYFERRPPKSTGREVYNDDFLEGISVSSPDNLVRTLVRFSVFQLVQSINSYLPLGKRIVVTGGGALNPVMIEDLKVLSGLDVEVPERTFLQAKEAMGMAVLAQEFFSGVEANVPSVTGARKRVVLGKLALP